MNPMFFSESAEDMHATAAELEQLAQWQAEVEALIPDPEPPGSLDQQDARLCHYILTGGE